MKFNEWLNSVIGAGLLCGNYRDKALNAQSKINLMNIVLDANGASYLCETQSKGFALPYETITKEFKSYINGRYIAEYKNDKGNGYTSTIYCCYCDSDDVHIKTTSTTFLGCKTTIHIKPYDFVQIYADSNCELKIICPESSRVKLDYWGNAKITFNDNCGRIDLKKH